MKAIIKATLDNAVRIWSRHPTPRAFTHLCLSGVTGRQFYNHVDPQAQGLFVLEHPTLGDWAALGALWKAPGGGPLHRFAGQTRTAQLQDSGGTGPTAVQKFAALDEIELLVLGHLRKFANGTRRNGQPFCGLAIDDSTLLDSISAAGIAYRSDTMQWADVSAQYKTASGGPRVDPDDVQETTVIGEGP